MNILKNEKNILIYEDGEVIGLYSYKSKIAEYNKKNIKLYIYKDWDRSQSTLKHLKEFINNFTNYYYYFDKKQFTHQLKNVKNGIKYISE